MDRESRAMGTTALRCGRRTDPQSDVQPRRIASFDECMSTENSAPKRNGWVERAELVRLESAKRIRRNLSVFKKSGVGRARLVVRRFRYSRAERSFSAHFWNFG